MWSSSLIHPIHPHPCKGCLRQAANKEAYSEKAADFDKEYLFKYVVI